MAQEGKKFDDDKPAMGLIPPHAEIELAKAFGYGAKKYGQWNFLGGIQYTRLVGAVRRHINAFMLGEDIDPESGNHHLGHALAGLAMLIEMQQVHPELDDRFKGYEATESSPISQDD